MPLKVDITRIDKAQNLRHNVSFLTRPSCQFILMPVLEETPVKKDNYCKGTGKKP